MYRSTILTSFYIVVNIGASFSLRNILCSCARTPGRSGCLFQRKIALWICKPISIPWQREVQDGVRQKLRTLPFSVPCPEPSLLSQPCPHQPNPQLHGDQHGFGSWQDLSLIPSWSQPSSGGGLEAVYLPRRWLQEPWHGGSLGALRAS